MQATRKKDAPRLPRPAGRYWKGKAPKGAEDISDDYDSDINGDGIVDTNDVLLQDDLQVDTEESHFKTATSHKIINITLSNASRVREKLEKEDDLVASKRLEDKEETKREEAGQKGEEEEEAESNYDSTESEATKPIVAFRPVFVPKRARETRAPEDSETFQREREKEAEIRRKQSHDLVAESIKRELTEKETEEHVPDVDDTDGLDLSIEFEAWRLRELNRIKRDKEEQFRREEEKAEIERRRALPEEERLKEDLTRAQKSREEKPTGSQKFLQKYWHKGAFHQDLEILSRHDYTQATESAIDVTLLPKIMQVRDYGKRSRTKYTHLVDQDTTIRHDGFKKATSFQPGAGQGCFSCGGSHLKKDCPQLVLINRTTSQGARRNDDDRSRGRDDIRTEHSQEGKERSSRVRRDRRSKSTSRERSSHKKQKVY